MLNKTLNFLKFGFKLIKQKLIKPFNKFNIAFSKPKLTPAKSIALILFLAFYGLTISFLINIIEAQGTCASGDWLKCSGTTLTDLAIDDKLGIGTAGSFARLEINIKETTIEGLHISREAATSYSYLNIEDDSGNPIFKVHESGNVGIGNTDLSEKLNVEGNAKITGDLTVGDVTGSVVPSGFCMFTFSETSCPSGWTMNTNTGRTFHIVTSGPGDTGGASTHIHSMQGHTHTLQNHIHSLGSGINIAKGSNYSNSTGGPSVGSTGPPSVSNTGPASSWPPYVEVIVCCKD